MKDSDWISRIELDTTQFFRWHSNHIDFTKILDITYGAITFQIYNKEFKYNFYEIYWDHIILDKLWGRNVDGKDFMDTLNHHILLK